MDRLCARRCAGAPSRPHCHGDGHTTPQPPRQAGSCPGEQRQAGAVQRDAGRGRARPANAGITLGASPRRARRQARFSLAGLSAGCGPGRMRAKNGHQ